MYFHKTHSYVLDRNIIIKKILQELQKVMTQSDQASFDESAIADTNTPHNDT